jgi:hypothetical protein
LTGERESRAFADGLRIARWNVVFLLVSWSALRIAVGIDKRTHAASAVILFIILYAYLALWFTNGRKLRWAESSKRTIAAMIGASPFGVISAVGFVALCFQRNSGSYEAQCGCLAIWWGFALVAGLCFLVTILGAAKVFDPKAE